MLIRSRFLLYSSRINPGIHKQIHGVSFPSFPLPILSSIFSGSLDLTRNLKLWFSDYSALSHVLTITLESRIKLRETDREGEGGEKKRGCSHLPIITYTFTKQKGRFPSDEDFTDADFYCSPAAALPSLSLPDILGPLYCL